jgi:hypothetical protein
MRNYQSLIVYIEQRSSQSQSFVGHRQKRMVHINNAIESTLFTLNSNRTNNAVYLFDLKMICAGYAYFSAFSIYIKKSSDNKEIRCPSTLELKIVNAIISHGSTCLFIEHPDDIDFWYLQKGWAIIPEVITKKHLSHFLKQRICLYEPLGDSIDIKLASKSALTHKIAKGKRRFILSRDAHTCVFCGANEKNGTKLTMQHIRPYSHGGETTSKNLVTFCQECNKDIIRNMYSCCMVILVNS